MLRWFAGIASALRAEANPTCPKYILVESASRGLPKIRRQLHWRQPGHSVRLSGSRAAQFSELAAIRYNGNAFEAQAIPLRRGKQGQPNPAASVKPGQCPGHWR